VISQIFVENLKGGSAEVFVENLAAALAAFRPRAAIIAAVSSKRSGLRGT
jgi:hypothetical protein